MFEKNETQVKRKMVKQKQLPPYPSSSATNSWQKQVVVQPHHQQQQNYVLCLSSGGGGAGAKRVIIISMSNGDLLSIQPTELKFPFELKKQSSCSLQLTNKTDEYVAFKVKTTNPKKYYVRPNTGIVLLGTTCDVTVTMQAQKEAEGSTT